MKNCFLGGGGKGLEKERGKLDTTLFNTLLLANADL